MKLERKILAALGRVLVPSLVRRRTLCGPPTTTCRAKANGLILVTHKTAERSRVIGLLIENREAPPSPSSPSQCLELAKIVGKRANRVIDSLPWLF